MEILSSVGILYLIIRDIVFDAFIIGLFFFIIERRLVGKWSTRRLRKQYILAFNIVVIFLNLGNLLGEYVYLFAFLSPVIVSLCISFGWYIYTIKQESKNGTTTFKGNKHVSPFRITRSRGMVVFPLLLLLASIIFLSAQYFIFEKVINVYILVNIGFSAAFLILFIVMFILKLTSKNVSESILLITPFRFVELDISRKILLNVNTYVDSNDFMIRNRFKAYFIEDNQTRLVWVYDVVGIDIKNDNDYNHPLFKVLNNNTEKKITINLDDLYRDNPIPKINYYSDYDDDY